MTSSDEPARILTNLVGGWVCLPEEIVLASHHRYRFWFGWYEVREPTHGFNNSKLPSKNPQIFLVKMSPARSSTLLTATSVSQAISCLLRQ
jgi:hypothetical protein